MPRHAARRQRPSIKARTTFNSRHKKGDAFDYNQEDPRVLLVRESDSKGVRWRTYLRCENSNAPKCTKADLHTDNAGLISAHVFDFTADAEQLGWQRIYAHPGCPPNRPKKSSGTTNCRAAIKLDPDASLL